MPRRVRLALLGAMALAALAFGAAYAYLVISTANAPRAAQLPSTASPSGSAATAPRAERPTQYVGAQGPWTVDSTNPGFVGYRAREVLGIDFFRAPNDAVARTSTVEGSLEIDGPRLMAADITADVSTLRSDEEGRDRHLIEYLHLEEHPNAHFRMTQPVDIGSPTQGRVVEISARGELTMIDVTRDVVFPLRARWDGDAINVAGQIMIRRSDYNMDVGQLLGFRVADEITIELELRFVRPCAEPCLADASPSPGPGSSHSPPSGSPAAGSPGPLQPSPSAAPSITADRPARTVRTLPGSGTLVFTGVTDKGPSVPPDIQVYSLRAGGQARQLTKETHFQREPAWSSDGRFLVVSDDSESSPPKLWVMRSDGSGRRIVTDERELHSPDWSPDGKRLVAVPASEQVGEILVVNIATGAVRAIVTDSGGIDETPDWSPDGRRIVFGRFPKAASNQDLWLVNPDGSGLRRLTRDAGYEYSPDWSPDGRRIAFIREGDVWTIGADGRAARRLTRGLKGDSPAWSPDGRRIAFTVENELWIMNSDGSGKTVLGLPFAVVAHPAWRPD